MCACGGGRVGRKSMFCCDSLDDWINVSSVFKKLLGIIIVLLMVVFINVSVVVS